ncbi:hypothetical protein VTJ49DRAFT_4517 [Mycothermus thermophilus]|uniref:NADPH-dependent diflavin oxidoreductase 1 n=1 Tax=Humicola insolens TaxID=85995 RepID=A0ABR3V5A8_HUMIN
MGDSGTWVQATVIPDRTMAVLYGSETGNSEEIAKEIGDLAERLHFQTTVGEMDSFKLGDVVRSSLVVFVTSTTGQGDMPKNTLKFWKNLRREKLNNTNCLGSMRFTIFGLGDSSYLKFNWAARKLRARLLQLGAAEFFKPGEGDERHDDGIDSIYFPWFEELKKTVLADFPLPDSIQPIPEGVQLPPKYPLEFLLNMEPRTKKVPDGGGDGDGEVNAPLSEDEFKYLATRFRCADRSHVDSFFRMSDADHTAEWMRRREPTFPADVARHDHLWEDAHPREFSLLDKANTLKDHPEKYLLEPTSLPDPAQRPPVVLLPVPGAWKARVLHNDRVTPPDHWQDVRFIGLQISVDENQIRELRPHIGNLTVAIFPMNYPEDVDELISLMGWEAEADIPLCAPQYRPKGLYPAYPQPTLRELLTHNLDITAVPKRSFIRHLSWLTNDEREKERLQELIAPGNQQELYDYTSRPRRTIIELLRDFPSVKVPLSRLLELFPVIRPREFSVANGSVRVFGDSGTRRWILLEILAALVEYKTIIRKPRQGLCSRYLKTLVPGSRISVQVRPGSSPCIVPNPSWAQRPMIAIATGTGIAPIRAIIERRQELCPDQQQDQGPGPSLLFFGCRNRAADFYFHHQWPRFPWLKVIPAFSRDGIEPAKHTTDSVTGALPKDDLTQALSAAFAGAPQYDAHKNYVQHMIRKHADEVAALLTRKDAVVCICGNAGRMPLSVRAALMDVLVTCKVVETVEDADKWLRNPEKVVYWQETW